MDKSKNNLNLKTFIYLLITLLNITEYCWISYIFPLRIYYQILFLTMLSLFANLGYFAMRLLNQMKNNSVKEVNQRRFFRFSFSLSFLVFIMYWGMILTDPKILMKTGRNPIPFVLDILIHGFNFILNLFEHLFISRKINDTDNVINYKVYLFFAILYTGIVKMVFLQTGWAPYPFVEHIQLKEFIILDSISLCIILLGDYLYKKISFL